jgi:hypothetical protein
VALVLNASTIKRLAERVQALERKLAPKKPWRAIAVEFPEYLDHAEVEARHFELFPEDRDANVLITRWRDDWKFDGPDTRENAAARQIAREEIRQHETPELMRLWCERAIGEALGTLRGAMDHRYAAEKVGAIVKRIGGLSDDEAFERMREAGLNTDDPDILQWFEHGRSSGRAGVTTTMRFLERA